MPSASASGTSGAASRRVAPKQVERTSASRGGSAYSDGGHRELHSFAASNGFAYHNVSAAVPALAFQPILSQLYGTGSVLVSAISPSAGIITYSVVSGPARVGSATGTGAAVALLGAGTVVLQASQQPAGNYLAAVTQVAFTIAPATPSMSFGYIFPQTFGQPSVKVNAYSNSPAAITYAVVSGPAILSGNVVTTTGSGTVVLLANQPASANYLAGQIQTSFAVTGASTSLKFTSIPAHTFGDSALTVSASSISTGAITYSVVSGPATVSGNKVAITGAGTVTLKASQAADSKYLATTAQISFVVQPAMPTLNFPGVATQTYGQAPVVLSATSNSPGAITFTIVNGPATLAGDRLTPTGVGNVVVLANQASTSNYTSNHVQISFTVKSEAPKITFNPVATQTYGVGNITVSAPSNSPGVMTYSVVSGPARVSAATNSGATISILGAGPVILGVTQQPSGVYSAGSAQTTFTVNPGTPTLAFWSVSTKTYGQQPFPVLAHSNSAATVSYKVVSGPGKISGNTVTMTGRGTVVLSASQPAGSNFTAAAVQTTFTIQ